MSGCDDDESIDDESIDDDGGVHGLLLSLLSYIFVRLSG